MHTRTSGGVRETLVKELAVTPYGGPPLPKTVVTVTPVGNLEQAILNCCWSKLMELIPILLFWTLDNARDSSHPVSKHKELKSKQDRSSNHFPILYYGPRTVGYVAKGHHQLDAQED
jgi:hypothetical protein